MKSNRWSRVTLVARDIDDTHEFYERVLGFSAVRCEIIKMEKGGEVQHVFCDTPRGQLLAFVEFRGVPGVPAE